MTRTVRISTPIELMKRGRVGFCPNWGWTTDEGEHTVCEVIAVRVPAGFPATCPGCGGDLMEVKA
jgi:hypothetical protein